METIQYKKIELNVGTEIEIIDCRFLLRRVLAFFSFIKYIFLLFFIVLFQCLFLMGNKVFICISNSDSFGIFEKEFKKSFEIYVLSFSS